MQRGQRLLLEMDDGSRAPLCKCATDGATQIIVAAVEAWFGLAPVRDGMPESPPSRRPE